MSKIKFTGINIAAAILVLFYFLPWVSITPISLSGFSITTNAISPGMLAYFISGLPRFYMILALVVPLSAAIILYQNITGNKRFAKYYKLAHIIPALYLIAGIIGLHFEMKPDVPDMPKGYGDVYNQISQSVSDMAPGVFDVLTFAMYISVIAAVYLLLVSFGKIKDKEYYKPGPAPVAPDNKGAAPAPESNDN